MKAIFKREFKSYFHTMTGPIFMTAFLIFLGIYFVAYNMVQGYPYFSACLSGVSIILLLVIPVLTMRSLAEERKTKTDQLLLTSPVSVTQIVMGKYLALVAVLGICMLIACFGPIIIHFYGGGAMFADYMAILAFFLLGAAYMAIGLFMSAITESQVISAVGTFCILLVLQLIDGLAGLLPTAAAASYVCLFVCIILIALALYFMTKNVYIADAVGIVGAIALTIVFIVKKTAFEGLFGNILSSLSLIARFDTIIGQSLDISTLVYYISIAGVFVFLTVQAIQKRRWS